MTSSKPQDGLLNGPLPALRRVDAFPVEIEGEQMVCLSDPAGYVEGQMIVSTAAFFIATGLDGHNDLDGIIGAFEKMSGVRAPLDKVQELVEGLNEAGLLDSPRFRTLREETDKVFRSSPVRPSWLSGKSYSSDPDELRSHLDELFVSGNGPGRIADACSGSKPFVTCLVSPHIDLERGGELYARAYHRLYEGGLPDLAIIFGVAHEVCGSPFVPLDKDLKTPLGTLPLDRDVCAKLSAACTWDYCEDQMLHRTEHSIEFQALMLAHTFGAKVPVLPILCGSLCEDPFSDDPTAETDAEEFLAVCREIVSDSSRRIVVIAGADLAHVGRRFGDDLDIDDALIEKIGRADRSSLRHLEKLFPVKFYESVMRGGNPRHVCGAAAIYAAMRSAEPRLSRMELLAYDYAPDPVGGIVSFAAMAGTAS